MTDTEKIQELEAMIGLLRREKDCSKVTTTFNIRTDQVDWISKRAVDNHRWGNKSAFVRSIIDKAMAESGDL